MSAPLIVPERLVLESQMTTASCTNNSRVLHKRAASIPAFLSPPHSTSLRKRPSGLGFSLLSNMDNLSKPPDSWPSPSNDATTCLINEGQGTGRKVSQNNTGTSSAASSAASSQHQHLVALTNTQGSHSFSSHPLHTFSQVHQPPTVHADTIGQSDTRPRRPSPPPRSQSYQKRHASFDSPREVPLPPPSLLGYSVYPFTIPPSAHTTSSSTATQSIGSVNAPPARCTDTGYDVKQSSDANQSQMGVSRTARHDKPIPSNTCPVRWTFADIDTSVGTSRSSGASTKSSPDPCPVFEEADMASTDTSPEPSVAGSKRRSRDREPDIMNTRGVFQEGAKVRELDRLLRMGNLHADAEKGRATAHMANLTDRNQNGTNTAVAGGITGSSGNTDRDLEVMIGRTMDGNGQGDIAQGVVSPDPPEGSDLGEMKADREQHIGTAEEGDMSGRSLVSNELGVGTSSTAPIFPFSRPHSLPGSGAYQYLQAAEAGQSSTTATPESETQQGSASTQLPLKSMQTKDATVPSTASGGGTSAPDWIDRSSSSSLPIPMQIPFHTLPSVGAGHMSFGGGMGTGQTVQEGKESSASADTSSSAYSSAAPFLSSSTRPPFDSRSSSGSDSSGSSSSLPSAPPGPRPVPGHLATSRAGFGEGYTHHYSQPRWYSQSSPPGSPTPSLSSRSLSDPNAYVASSAAQPFSHPHSSSVHYQQHSRHQHQQQSNRPCTSPSSPTSTASAGLHSGRAVTSFPPPEPPTILPASQQSSEGGGDPSRQAPYEPFLSHAPPPVDCWIEVETMPGEYRLDVRLPGFKRDGITLATRRRRILHVVADSWDQGGGHFERRISFGYDADLTQVRAEFDGTMLRVFVPRRMPSLSMWTSHSAPIGRGRQ